MDPRDRFLQVFNTIQELPQEFSKAIEEQWKGEEIQKIFWIPPYDYPIVRSFWRIPLPFEWKSTPPRSLLFTTKNVLLGEKNGQGKIKVFVIPYGRIFHTEIAINLLYAYIFISWAEGSEPASRRIEFNAVGEYQMRRQLDSLRLEHFSSVVMDAPDDGNRNIFVADPESKPVPLKFSNYLIYSLVGEERVIAAVYQSAIRRGKTWFSGILHPRRLVALTDRHMIVIEEDYSIGANYSVITRFYPLNRVERIDFITDQADLVRVNISEVTNGCREEVTIPLKVPGALWLRKALVKIGVKTRDLIPE